MSIDDFEDILEPQEQPQKRFQIRSDKLFLTFPQCSTPLKDFCQRITQHFGDSLAYGVVSQEEHQDGNKHLHAAICLKAKLTINHANELDVLVSPPQHGNYCGRFKGGVLKAMNYVMKDGNYLPLPFADPTRFDLLNLTLEALKKVKKTELVLGLIQAGAGLDELDDIEPAFVMTNLMKLQNYFGYRTLKARRRAFVLGRSTKIDAQPAPGLRTLYCARIASWLNANIRQPRVHRQKQLWIKSAPGAGKTTMIMMLEQAYGLSVYYWPKDEKWWDGYDDGAYDLIVLDEFKAQKKISELNPILSGDPTPVSRRNRPPIVKRDNIPVVIMSNFTPRECYHKASTGALDPLLDRLTVVELPPREVLRFVFNNPTPIEPEPLTEEQANLPEPGGLSQQELDDLCEELRASCPINLDIEDPGESIEATGLLDDDALSEELSSSDLEGFMVPDHYSSPEVFIPPVYDQDVLPHMPRAAYDPDWEEALGLAHDYVWSKEVSVPLQKTDRSRSYQSAPYRR